MRLFSTSEQLNSFSRIRRSLIVIPEGYKVFLRKRLEGDDHNIYPPNLRLFVHLLDQTPEQSAKVVEIQGREEIFSLLERMKVLMKWGHFCWRLSDFSALELEPIRIIRPILTDNQTNPIEMKIYWQFKVNCGNGGTDGVVYIDGEKTRMNLKSLIQVQLQRFKLIQSSQILDTDKILFSGINRYIFDPQSGYCKEVHVERVEPKIDGIDWRWKMGKVKFSQA